MMQITKDFAEMLIRYADAGNTYALSANEQKQLAMAWLQHDSALSAGEDGQMLDALKHYIKESDGITIAIPFELAHAIQVNLECQAIGLVQYGKATVRPNSQDWAGMDGATAYHLIERHADGWDDIRLMMAEWLAANAALSPTQGNPK